MYDVLFIFSDNLLQHSHVYSSSSWIFTLDNQVFNVRPGFVSNIFRLEQFLISFTYIKNTIGPKIEPCGTPVLIFKLVAGFPFISVY